MKIIRLFTVFIIMAVLTFAASGRHVSAAEPAASENSVSAERIMETDERIYFDTASGVTELDDSLNRGKTLLVGVIHFFGGAVALFGLIFAAIGFLGRDNEQKIIGITAFIVGVAVFFAPQIVNAVVGQTVF